LCLAFAYSDKGSSPQTVISRRTMRGTTAEGLCDNSQEAVGDLTGLTVADIGAGTGMKRVRPSSFVHPSLIDLCARIRICHHAVFEQ
jgi:hypothetical protein